MTPHRARSDRAPARAGRWSSASRSTASWPPRPSCSAAAPTSFGDEPNTNVCPVCLGLPGSLPVLNEQVVELAMRLGRALALRASSRSVFARKNYFYPDMPKDYQVSPVRPADQRRRLPRAARRAPGSASSGPTSRRTPARSTHVGGGGRIHDADYSLVDYNRAGVPLVEIVGRARHPHRRAGPGLRRRAAGDPRWPPACPTPRWRRARCGSTPTSRCAAVGDAELGTRCEIKNLNSLRSLGRAIDYEARRQIDLLEAGERVAPGDPPLGRGRRAAPAPLRSKEEADDYRYFPEPDLVPLEPDRRVGRRDRRRPAGAAGRRRRAALADGRRRRRHRRRRGRSPSSAASTTSRSPPSPPAATPARVLTHVEHNLAVDGAESLDPAHLAAARGAWRRPASSPPRRPRRCSAEMVASGRGPRRHRRRAGLRGHGHRRARGRSSTGSSPTSPDEWERVPRRATTRPGASSPGFFVGKVMKATKGQADGKAVTAVLDARRAAAS